MPRPPRITEAGLAYHVLNCRVTRLPIFNKDRDYAAFERILAQGQSRPDALQLLAYCLMPNHWHLILLAGPRSDLSGWMQWIQVTHTHRWHANHHTAGQGPLYQGRFKCFPIQQDVHFLTACRYVEANAVRAKLVKRAEHWPWGSLSVRRGKPSPSKPVLGEWPVDRPRNWLAEVNRSMDEEPVKAIRSCIARGTPMGSETWQKRVASRLELDLTLRPRGRPRKED
ncbi:MAG: transposase [Planctomycetes bacterium]|nr:transposase [Planctomycetota bacterium]